MTEETRDERETEAQPPADEPETHAREEDGADSERALPELSEAQRAFDVGDYRRVRELTDSLRTDSDADVRAAAQALRRRVSVDPFQVGLLLACLVFFVYISWHYIF